GAAGDRQRARRVRYAASCRQRAARVRETTLIRMRGHERNEHDTICEREDLFHGVPRSRAGRTQSSPEKLYRPACFVCMQDANYFAAVLSKDVSSLASRM